MLLSHLTDKLQVNHCIREHIVCPDVATAFDATSGSSSAALWRTITNRCTGTRATGSRDILYSHWLHEAAGVGVACTTSAEMYARLYA